MDRILVIGCGGSGKTRLARQLAEVLDVPLTHLDGVYYDPEWNTLPQEEFAACQRELVDQNQWVIEGNYASTLPIRLAAADTVIFLDLPAVTCLLGVLQRRWRYRGGQHSNDGVFDRITPSFLRYIWGYRRSMRPRVQRLITEHGDHAELITLRSRTQATRWLGARRMSAHAGNGQDCCDHCHARRTTGHGTRCPLTRGRASSICPNRTCGTASSGARC